VWLKPLLASKVVREENERGVINDGSVFKMTPQASNTPISIGDVIRAAASNDQNLVEGADPANLTEDYASCFKVIQVGEERRLRDPTLASLVRFLRMYDEQMLRKVYDFTEKAVRKMLSKVLVILKRLCRNQLVTTLQLALPYKVPNPDIQSVAQASHLYSSSAKPNASTSSPSCS
jgi:hypothetical protein